MNSLTGQEVRVVAIKTGAGVLEQGKYLQALRKTGAVVKVTRLLEDGYVMPVLHPVEWTASKRLEAVGLAKALARRWYVEVGVCWAFDEGKFLNYLRARASNPEMAAVSQQWNWLRNTTYSTVDERYCQHGDLAWDNVMCDETGGMQLIDALPPKDGSLPAPLTDAGKIYLSSLPGWRGTVEGVPRWSLASYVGLQFNVPEELIKFSAVVHLLRIRPYARRAMNNEMIRFCEDNLGILLGL